VPRFVSTIDTSGEDYRRNREGMLALIDELRGLEARARAASEKSAERFSGRGQILPRERLERILDPGRPFIELCNLAGYSTLPDDPQVDVPGASQIAGIGHVSGTRCMLVVNDSGVAAGAFTRLGGEKIMRCQEIALENRLPFIHLVESAGANLLQYRVEFFVRGGALFRNLARLSAAGIPVVTLLHGSSTAGGAYMPGLSDQVIAVRGRAKAFLGGPPLVKAATGEVASDEELGGADMHATVSGLAEYVAEDDVDAIRIGREVMARLGWERHRGFETPSGFAEPACDPDELAGIVPLDFRQPYDMREVAARIADGSELLDFKADYGPHTVCLQAEIHGHPCGLIGNNGPIDNDGATKAAHFIQYCCQAGHPIVYLQNTTGYMVGRDYERGGMIKHGSKMIQAVANATVPQITLMTGASFGAGNYGMCGRGFAPAFILSWPNAQTGVMGGEQAATTMSIVAEAAAKRRGEDIDRDQLAKQEDRIRALFDGQASAFHTSGRLLDDGVIDPRHTRPVLGELLATVLEARSRHVRPNTFGVQRP